VHGVVHPDIMRRGGSSSGRFESTAYQPSFADRLFRFCQSATHVRRTVCIAIFVTSGRNLMRKIGIALAIVAVMSGSVATAQTAYAA
jgi:hypothetical protein